jgi:pyruvate formate lyase activating enzyme
MGHHPKIHKGCNWIKLLCTSEEAMMSKKGFITNFQDLAVHDGTGLRVILFLKGCPLRCTWCQNPEAATSDYELMFHERLCKGCNKCFEVCEDDAIIKEGPEKVDRSKCTNCMKCADACPTGALARKGRWITSDEVVKVFMDYKAFFDNSDDGGITLSGGDPLFQPEFTIDVLKKCQEKGIHTAIETCGYANYSVVSEVIKHLDLLMYDIKHMDEEKHKQGTGVSNKVILDNLTKIRGERPDLKIFIRIPLIPGFNDDEENIMQTSKFLASIGIAHLDLLPFNFLAISKYDALGVDWKHEDVERQDDEYLNKLLDIAQSYIPDVTIGGMR